MPKNATGRYVTPWLGMTPQFQILWAIYWIAALCYAGYGLSTESGLYAYLIKLELDVLGTAEKELTGVLAFCLLVAPFWALTRIVGNLAPSLVWASRPETGLAKPGLIERLNRPVRGVSWKVVLLVTAIPILVGAVVYPVTYYSEQRDRQEKVYPIDVTSGVADLPKGAKFVDLTGLLARPYALSFKNTANYATVSHELFAPITSREWTPADPIRYFVHVKQYNDAQGQVEWPDAFRQKAVARFSGRMSRPLPAFVESEYRSKGLKLGPSYSVIEWHDLPHPQGSPPSEDAEMLLGFCLLTAVMLFLMMILVKVQLARIRKRQAAPG